MCVPALCPACLFLWFGHEELFSLSPSPLPPPPFSPALPTTHLPHHLPAFALYASHALCPFTLLPGGGGGEEGSVLMWGRGGMACLHTALHTAHMACLPMALHAMAPQCASSLPLACCCCLLCLCHEASSSASISYLLFLPHLYAYYKEKYLLISSLSPLPFPSSLKWKISACLICNNVCQPAHASSSSPPTSSISACASLSSACNHYILA